MCNTEETRTWASGVEDAIRCVEDMARALRLVWHTDHYEHEKNRVCHPAAKVVIEEVMVSLKAMASRGSYSSHSVLMADGG